MAKVMNRPTDYPLLGEVLCNYVIDAAVVRRRFIGADKTTRLTREFVQQLAFIHLYAPSDMPIETDPCIQLKELQRLNRNPFNGRLLTPAHVLFAIGMDCLPSTR